MGMIVVLALGLYALLAIIIIALISRFITKNRWVIGILTTIAILIPTYDIIITNILGVYYCLSEPNPKTLIKKKVEYPLSIYWEDNVYPGFNAEDRKLMITNYLDGVHLKTMALNGDDGNVYVYTRDVPKEKYEQLSSRLIQEQNQFNQLDKEFDRLYQNKEPFAKVRDARLEAMKKVDSVRGQLRRLVDNYQVNEKIYTKQTMPKMNYTVTFNEIKLNPLSHKFLYSDETKIIDNNTSEVIAYNRRYMHFFYNITPDFQGGNYYDISSLSCGKRMEHLVYEVFDAYIWTGTHAGGTHIRDLNAILIKRNLKGEQ